MIPPNKCHQIASLYRYKLVKVSKTCDEQDIIGRLEKVRDNSTN